MRMISQPVRTVSIILIGIGSILLGMNIFLDGSLNVALPLIFLLLGLIFLILVYPIQNKWNWASILYIPGSLLLAFGLIFLINILTNDWNAWAYAWLLLIAGAGVGMVMASQNQQWPPLINLVGWGLTLGGITLFAVFGAIAGGHFIQIMAPILLVLAGISLRWLHLETILPEHILKRFHQVPMTMLDGKTAVDQKPLDEPLSSRELEVIELINQGLSNQQIAQKLHIAPSTVKSHINNTYGKLGVQTRVQAVIRARDLNLLDS